MADNNFEFKNINLEINNKIFAKSNLKNNNNVDVNRVIEYKLEIYYYNKKLGVLYFPGWTLMENVRTVILNQFPIIKSTSVDLTSAGVAIEYSQKVCDLKNENFNLSIEVKEVKKEDNEPDIYKKMMEYINSQELIEFNANFIVSTLKIDKNAWRKLESNVLKNKSKFKGHFNIIKSGTSRNLVCTLYCIYYIEKNNLRDNYHENEEDYMKLKINLQNNFNWDLEFKKDFEELIDF